MKENMNGITEDSCYSSIKINTADGVKKEKRFTSFGPMAVVTALMASVCCVVPFVLVMLGVSGAWIGNLRALEPYKPIFILFTIGFLIAGFYSIYRKPKESCKPGSLCSVSQTRKVQKIMLWIAAVVAVVLLALPYLIAWLAQ